MRPVIAGPDKAAFLKARCRSEQTKPYKCPARSPMLMQQFYPSFFVCVCSLFIDYFSFTFDPRTFRRVGESCLYVNKSLVGSNFHR